MNSVCLAIIFNHKYEQNIPLLRQIYGDRFSNILFLSPFYRGNDKDVVSTADSTFYFHGIVYQAREALKRQNADYYLFIGDDLLLDPEINENNLWEKLGLEAGKRDHYISGIGSIGSNIDWKYDRFKNAETAFSRSGVNYKDELPEFNVACQKAEELGLKDYLLKKKKIRARLYSWKHNIRSNAGIILGNLFNPAITVNYPLACGYSDMFIIPGRSFDDIMHYFGVFAAMNLFVEIAVPTAFMLGADAESIVQDKDLHYLHALAWHRSEVIDEFTQKCNQKIKNIEKWWPANYLYLHPVKLSKWN